MKRSHFPDEGSENQAGLGWFSESEGGLQGGREHGTGMHLRMATGLPPAASRSPEASMLMLVKQQSEQASRGTQAVM